MSNTPPPHAHYYLDQVDTSIWAVVCSACETHVGLVNNTDKETWTPLADFHWDQKVAEAWMN